MSDIKSHPDERFRDEALEQWRRAQALGKCLSELLSITNPLMSQDPREVHRVRVKAENLLAEYGFDLQ